MKPLISNFVYPATISTSGKDRRLIYVEETYPFSVDETEFDSSDCVFSIDRGPDGIISWHMRNGALLRPILSADGYNVAKEHMLAEPLSPLTGTEDTFPCWADHPFFEWRPWSFGDRQHAPGLTRSHVEANDPLLKSATTETFKKWRGDSRDAALSQAISRTWFMRRDGDVVYRPAGEPLYAVELDGRHLTVSPWLGGRLHNQRCQVSYFRANEREVAIQAATLMVEAGLEADDIHVHSDIIEVHGDHIPSENLDIHLIKSLSTVAFLDARKLSAGGEDFGAISRYVDIRNCLEALANGSDERVRSTMDTILKSELHGAERETGSYWNNARLMHHCAQEARQMHLDFSLDAEAIALP